MSVECLLDAGQGWSPRKKEGRLFLTACPLELVRKVDNNIGGYWRCWGCGEALGEHPPRFRYLNHIFKEDQQLTG